jgi:hypothetical protein
MSKAAVAMFSGRVATALVLSFFVLAIGGCDAGLCSECGVTNEISPSNVLASPVLTMTIFPAVIWLGESAVLDVIVNDSNDLCSANEGCRGPCTASDGWSGTPAPSGKIVTPAIVGRITYTVSCPANDGSTASVSARLTVRPRPPRPKTESERATS